MTSLSNDLYGGSDLVKAEYLKKGIVLGKTIVTQIPPLSGNGAWGAKTIFEWRPSDYGTYTNVVKDMLIKVSLPAITQTTGNSQYNAGIGLSFFQNLTVWSNGNNITANLDCRKLWPLLVYATREVEFTRLTANLHMLSTDAQRRSAIEIYLPLDIIFAWANANVLDIVNGPSLRIEIVVPAYTSVINTSGTYSVADPTDIQLVVDRDYNQPYVNKKLMEYKSGFYIEDPNSGRGLAIKPGLSMPDFRYLYGSQAVGASDTSATLDLSLLKDYRMVILFFYLQTDASIAAGTEYNNYQPISTARLYYASNPLDKTDLLSYKSYGMFHSMIDNINSLNNTCTYLIGTTTSGSTNANMIIVDYSDANLQGVGYSANLSSRFSGFMNWRDQNNVKFDCTFTALGGAGQLSYLAVTYRELAVQGSTLGNCNINEILR